ncbi:MAG: glycosyltransferase family 2 protein [Anaeromyxobacteraceae bacterium]
MQQWREAVRRVASGVTPTGCELPARAVELAVVVPCFNEGAVLPETVERLAALRASLVAEGLAAGTSTVWFVDDGSRDETWHLVEEAARIFPWVHGVKLSRNRGHQNALLAGLQSVEAEATVTVDADLQDDLGAIREMLLRFLAGAEVVYGVRRARTSDSWFKRVTAEGYYRLLARLGVDVVFNHADYRLLGRRAVAALREYREVNLFLRGIVPQLGFRAERVLYDRAGRFAGESKYPLRKMLSFAWDGVTSFSAVPLRWITALGFVVSACAFAIGTWAIVVRLADIGAVPGWTSTVVPVAFLGGIQLLSIGVIGEYVGKIYGETKRRPRFVVEKRI